MSDIPAASPEKVGHFLREIASQDSRVRHTAWQNAARMGAAAVSGLGDLAASADKGVAKAANGALEEIAHYAARPGAPDEAHAVSEQLLGLAASGRPRAVRAHALHLLGFVGDARAVPEITRLLPDTDVGDEARMALERLQGDKYDGEH